MDAARLDRAAALERVAANPAVAVLIIGGGVNGIGAFRDLALQGMDVLLVERADFCSGASAASSHMIHGGIRYLENGEFRLVREAVNERNLLLKNAPHLVHPLATTIPIFKWVTGLFNAPLKFFKIRNRPAERGAAVIKAGLMLYDAYTAGQNTVPRHDFMLRQASLKRFPALNPDIVCTATYYDAAMPSPERICVELLLDTVAAAPAAIALNYVKAVGREGAHVTLRDEESGRLLTVRPAIVVNAAGPWIDFANAALGRPSDFVGGTKGSHIVLDHPGLLAAIDGHEFFFENDDGRIVLIYPFLDRVLVGTTDIPIDKPDEARCTEAEVDYFLDFIRHIFPDVKPGREHIVFRFSGVRPLPPDDRPNAGQITRDHTIEVLEPAAERPFPVLSLVGGKWTTFRAFGEKVTDRVLARLGRERRVSTRPLPIGGGRDYPTEPAARAAWIEALQRESGLPAARATQLFERYGTRATAVAAYLIAAPDAPLNHHPGYSRREIAFLATHEGVVHLDDLILRRTLIGMQGELTAPLLAELTAVVGESLDWDDAQRAAEADRVAAIMADRHQTVLA